MTEKLYYSDSHLREFAAHITGMKEVKDGFEVTLDRTAFFPEGGGQPCDTGYIGSARVTAVFERDGDVVHRTDSLPGSGTLKCVIDWEKRWRSMQTHTAEHIVSGIVHDTYGYDNVGFHLGAEGAIVDFDGYLTPDQIGEVERRANETVWRNAAVKTWFPSGNELKSLSYRSKLDLTENVRLVEIAGCDLCACCATHVDRTGEIGVIKIMDSIRRHESGVRIRMIAGEDAYGDYVSKFNSVGKISALLSAPPEKTPEYVERVLNEKAAADFRVTELTRKIALLLAEAAEKTEGNLLFFEPCLDGDGLRAAVNAGKAKCGGICAAFAGSDEEGYRYCMGSSSVDLRQKAREINAALSGRGGGQPEMIQGSLSAKRAEIEKYFA